MISSGSARSSPGVSGGVEKGSLLENGENRILSKGLNFDRRGARVCLWVCACLRQQEFRAKGRFFRWIARSVAEEEDGRLFTPVALETAWRSSRPAAIDFVLEI